MQVLIWVVTGVVAGWLAGLLMKGRDYGIAGNLILGLLGSLVGGWVVHLLGFAGPADWPRQTIVSLLGAMVVLGIARRLRPVAREGRKALGNIASVADIEAQFRKLGDLERRVLQQLQGRGPRPRDPNEAFDEQMTFGERVADKVATFGGSWTFIGIFLLMMVVWMITNNMLARPFDAYPFILLNLVLSCLAALQAPVIMMSQNRQAAKDRMLASNDFQVNLRTETDLAHLHAHFDELREKKWAELVEMQQKQIELLERLLEDAQGRGGAVRE